MKEIYKDQGLKKPQMQMIKRILKFIFTTNSAIWFEKDLSEKLVDYKTKLSVEVDFTSINQSIEWLKSLNLSWVVHPQEITTALKYNHFWPSVSVNGKIIGCIKIGFGNVFIVDYNRIMEFPEKMVFFYDTYVLQEGRNKGVAKYLISESVKYLKEKGYTKIKCHIAPWNKASISVYERIGFKKVSYIRYFRIFGVPFRLENTIKENLKITRSKLLREDMLDEQD